MNLRKIYKKIAQEHGITIQEVKRDMQEAINSAYIRPNIYARYIPRKCEIPTVEEFIEYVSNRINTFDARK